MEYSAGFAIICDNKILLTHPKQCKNINKMWGIPKGKIEKDEDLKQAAIRETKEEIGLDLSHLLEGHVLTWYEIKYSSKTKGVYKKLFYSVIKVESLSYLGIHDTVLDDKQLSEREIDSARFFSLDEASNITFWRQKTILKWLSC